MSDDPLDLHHGLILAAIGLGLLLLAVYREFVLGVG